MSQLTQRSVKAHYDSPGDVHEFSIPVSAPCTADTTANRTKYLGELRSNTKRLQADVNKFLTEKMEQDKQKANASGKQVEKQAEAEEQNYGEEQAEED